MFGVCTKRAFRYLDVVGGRRGGGGERNPRSVFWHSQADVKIDMGMACSSARACRCPDKYKANKWNRSEVGGNETHLLVDRSLVVQLVDE